MLDNNRLGGKVAFITGAAGEIGAATVKLMIARGARIVAVDRDKSVAHSATNSREASGRINIFFNDAGIEGRPIRS